VTPSRPDYGFDAPGVLIGFGVASLVAIAVAVSATVRASTLWMVIGYTSAAWFAATLQQVLGALAVARVNPFERITRIAHKAKQISTDAEELVDQFLELGCHVSIGRWTNLTIMPVQTPGNVPESCR
jgi:hypothetical protein